MQLWSAESGTCYHTYRGHTGEIICLTFDPLSTMIASGGIDATARLWSVEHGTELATLAVSLSGQNEMRSPLYSTRPPFPKKKLLDTSLTWTLSLHS